MTEGGKGKEDVPRGAAKPGSLMPGNLAKTL